MKSKEDKIKSLELKIRLIEFGIKFDSDSCKTISYKSKLIKECKDKIKILEKRI